MLNKLDLELFKILDSERDKKIGFGSWFGYDCFGCRFLYYQATGMEVIDVNNQDNNYIPYVIGVSSKELTKDCKILGHYPTTNEILRYLNKSICICKIELTKRYLIINLYTTLYDEKGETYPKNESLHLDLTKPIQQYTDKQKQELVTFLKLIK